MTTTTCPGCGVELPAAGGPTHRYLGSNAECWAVYGEVLAREYGDGALFDTAHRWTVDAYAAQHPDGQPATSLVVHLVALYLLLDRAADHAWVSKAMDACIRKGGPYPDLPRPADLGPITALDVLQSETPAETARRWAEQVWAAWSASHAAIAELMPRPETSAMFAFSGRGSTDGPVGLRPSNFSRCSSSDERSAGRGERSEPRH